MSCLKIFLGYHKDHRLLIITVMTITLFYKATKVIKYARDTVIIVLGSSLNEGKGNLHYHIDLILLVNK